MLVVAGKLKKLKAIHDWCQAVYHLTYGPLFGEVNFRRLSLLDAVALWSRK